MTIRKARREDLPAILEIYAKAVDGGRALSMAQAREFLRRLRRYPSYDLYVATSGKRVVGAFELLIMDNLGHLGARSGIVEDVAVHPDWQGRGVGKAMMRHALAVCRKAKCYKMALSSNLIRRRAHRFYESLGFKKHGFSFLIEP